jgi:ATP-dependent exoDNAse (exonuclease V) alpha subunit
MQQRHKEMAAKFGNQPDHVIEATKTIRQVEPSAKQEVSRAALKFSEERNFEREAVSDERTLLRDALKRSMGESRLGEVKDELAKRIDNGGLIEVERNTGKPGRVFTTSEMLAYERDTIEIMRAGQGKHMPLGNVRTCQEIEQEHAHLSQAQRRAVEQVLGSRDKVMALEGLAGAGKTTSLAAIRDAAERVGYKLEGFAPTSRAAQKLAEAGIQSSTLQRHLARSQDTCDGRIQLYVLDESSLAGTKQMNQFLHRLQREDRVLLVGDTRQHQAVEAGTPYQQLQEAGIQTTRLEEIVRQKDPKLKEVVRQLARGDVRGAIEELDAQGRVHQILERGERLAEIAREYAKKPEGTLVVSPDNQSRKEINEVIHRAMQRAGQINQREHRIRTLMPRQEITSADRQWAAQYETGDVVRYTRGSKAHGIKAGEYARLERVDEKNNRVTVKRKNGEEVNYDPRRLHGVTLYRVTERAFSKGDRVQFTAPNRERHIANRELGTIEKIDKGCNLQLRLDSGRTVALNVKENPHLDYGYAVTSHCSQGQTADRVLVHVDTEQAGEKLVNRRLAYVAVSRGRYDAQLYTNNKTQLSEQLSRDVSRQTAMEQTQTSKSAAQMIGPNITTRGGATIAQGLSASRASCR